MTIPEEYKEMVSASVPVPLEIRNYPITIGQPHIPLPYPTIGPIAKPFIQGTPSTDYSFLRPDAWVIGGSGALGIGLGGGSLDYGGGIEAIRDFEISEWSGYTYHGSASTFGGGGNAAIYTGVAWNYDNTRYQGPTHSANITFSLGLIGGTIDYSWSHNKGFLGGAFSPDTTRSLIAGWAPGARASFSLSNYDTQKIERPYYPEGQPQPAAVPTPGLVPQGTVIPVDSSDELIIYPTPPVGVKTSP